MKRSVKILLSLGLISVFAVFAFGCETEVEETDVDVPEVEEVDLEPQTYVGDSFALEYPGTWVYEQPADHVLIFSGPEGTEAFDSTVNVQTLAMGEVYQEIADLYEDFKVQLEGVGGTISEMVEKDFHQDGEVFEAAEFSAEYEDVVVFNQFMMVVDRGDGYLHQVSYTAPENIYDEYEPVAMAIIESFQLI